MEKEEYQDKFKKHLDWSSKQGRILTSEGKATQLFSPERGFSFRSDELPHYHWMANSTYSAFDQFYQQNKNQKHKHKFKSLVCGAWKRSLFMGSWENSTDHDEHVYNIQTNTLFIDLRIPTTKPVGHFYELGQHILERYISSSATETSSSSASALASKWLLPLSHMSDLDLKIYARQHVFAGYTVITHENKRPLGTRHHCMDWNFVGIPRNRPNKWYIEVREGGAGDDTTHGNPHTHTWKEWSYAKNDYGQHYYCEQWERLENDSLGDGLVLAMRKAPGYPRDGILVIVGDHFNYVHGRIMDETATIGNGNASNTLVDLVDTSLEKGDRKTVESYLSIDAGHGTIQSGWRIDCAIQSWRHGTPLINEHGVPSIVVDGKDIFSCHIWWDNEQWNLMECSLETVDELRQLFESSGSMKKDLSKL